MNLKPWFLIKNGYYIVPSPSTALVTPVKNLPAILTILKALVEQNSRATEKSVQ